MFGKEKESEKERTIQISLNEEVADLLHFMYPSDKEKSNFLTFTVLKKAIWMKKMEIEILKKKMDFLVEDQRLKEDEGEKPQQPQGPN